MKLSINHLGEYVVSDWIDEVAFSKLAPLVENRVTEPNVLFKLNIDGIRVEGRTATDSYGRLVYMWETTGDWNIADVEFQHPCDPMKIPAKAKPEPRRQVAAPQPVKRPWWRFW